MNFKFKSWNNIPPMQLGAKKLMLLFLRRALIFLRLAAAKGFTFSKHFINLSFAVMNYLSPIHRFEHFFNCFYCIFCAEGLASHLCPALIVR